MAHPFDISPARRETCIIAQLCRGGSQPRAVCPDIHSTFARRSGWPQRIFEPQLLHLRVPCSDSLAKYAAAFVKFSSSYGFGNTSFIEFPGQLDKTNGQYRGAFLVRNTPGFVPVPNPPPLSSWALASQG